MSIENMANLPAMMPPSGVESNFVNPNSHDKANIILHTICLTLVTIFMFIRIYTRHFITHWLDWDDYFCLLAYAMTIVFSALLLTGQHYGVGHHLWDIRAIELTMTLKILFVVEIMYLPLVTVLKISFLLFFGRIFSPSTKMRYLTRYGIFAFGIFYTAIFFRSLFLCDPMQKSWNPALPGHCLNFGLMAYTTGIFNIISDLYILFLPLPFIWGLKMTASRKLRIIAVFSVGVFACAASILRLALTILQVNRPDKTWEIASLSLWVVLEVNVGIICSCSLALPAFIDHYWPHGLGVYCARFLSYFTFSSSNQHSKSGSGAYRNNIGALQRLSVLRKEEDRVHDMSGNRDDFVLKTTVRGKANEDEDTESWAAHGVLRTVDVQQSYAMAMSNTAQV